MKLRFKALILLLIITGSFLAGYWLNRGAGGGSQPTEQRRILYYADPMNPAYRSDKPGISPTCGMPLEPVYADQGDAGGAAPQAQMPPGTIRISPEKQQLIGVKVMTVEKAPWSHTLRALGRVTPDETRVYRINAATDGWIEDVLPVTTGSLVKENELLATLSFFSLEYRTLVQNYFNVLTLDEASSAAMRGSNPASKYSAPQLKQMRETSRNLGKWSDTSQIDYYKKNLFNYGISPYQLKEMERTHKMPEVVEIRAPAAGFLLFRNVSPGLRLDRGAELFRIADLSRVWILTDIFENEARFFRPGIRVRMELPYRKENFYARISPVLPQFDPATRTLKVRLEADNPGYSLRPDMFVNVELPIEGSPAMIVPAEAVLDSGLKKTVFVDRGNGLFEQRQVETGRSLGERVEVVHGLMPGERIVVSGNFLIDSEARMQQAAAGSAGKVGRDPVCGMNIDEDRSRKEGNLQEYKGKTYFFCSGQCRDDFGREPDRYLKSTPAQGSTPMPGLMHNAAKQKMLPKQASMPMPHDMGAMPVPGEGTVMPKPEDPMTVPQSDDSPAPGPDAEEMPPSPSGDPETSP